MSEQLKLNVTQCEEAVTAAVAALDAAEQHLKECEAEYRAAEAEAPKLTVTDLAKRMAAENQARRAGLVR